MIQQHATDSSSGEVKFFNGQTLADVNAGVAAEDNTVAETPETPETPAPKEEKPVVTPKSEPATVETSAETDTDDQPEGDEYDAIVAKYNGDPKAMAKALKSLQQGFTRKSETLKRVLSNQQRVSEFRESNGADFGHRPQPAPKETLAPADDEVSETMLDAISTELVNDPKKGIKRLLTESRQAGKAAFERAEAARRAEAEANRAREVENHNVSVINERAREILLERAEQSGDEDAIALYGDPKYVVTNEDYLDAYDDLEQEVSYINQAISPKDGRLTPKHFQAARIMLNPEGYNETLQRKSRSAALAAETTPRQPQPRTRVVLNPQASVHRANKKFDVSKFNGTATEFQQKLSTMTDAEIADIERQLVG